MSIKIRWLIPVIIIMIVAGVYLYPAPNKSVDELYAKVDAETMASLTKFRGAHPVRTLELHGVKWEYLSLGDGPETILFLHGMTGAYDIWWQQMEALQVPNEPTGDLEVWFAGVAPELPLFLP